MRRNYVQILLIVMLACLAAIPSASAYSAELLSPASTDTSLHSGDVISIKISGLAAPDQFKYRITSSDLQTPGNTVTLSNVNMPFGFQTGTSKTTLITTGTVAGSTSLMVRSSDGSETTLSSSGNTIYTEKNVKKDTYTVTMSGTKTSADSNIGIDYSVSGTVQDPGTNPSTLSFTLSNVNSGHITIEVLEGSTSHLLETFTITVAPTPTPAPTTAQNEPASDNDYGGAPGGPAAAPGAPAVAAPALLAPTGVSATTATIQHNDQGQVLADYVLETDPAAGFSSTVSIGQGTTVVNGPGTPNAGQPVGEISITPLDPATISATAQSGVFSFSGLSVECEPTGAQFSGGSATVSFSLTPAQWADALSRVNGNTAAMTIQTYDPATKSWIDVPTIVDPVTHTVSAQVTHFSTYALFYKTGTETASPQTIGDLVKQNPTPVVTSAAAPSVSPVKTRMAPVETPGQSGGIFDGIVNWFNNLFKSK